MYYKNNIATLDNLMASELQNINYKTLTRTKSKNKQYPMGTVIKLNSNMLQLSVIIPAYNVENYIEKCIRSIYGQDIPVSDYEVIVVNDRSTDNTEHIITSLCKEFTTLQLINHQQNKHAGGARNTGLKLATGKYILFIDPDDYLTPNSLSSLLTEANKDNLDILMGDHFYSNNDQLEKNIYFSQNTTEIYSGSEFLKKNIHTNYVWQYLFKRSFLLENYLSFRENIARQDVDFVLKAIYKSNRIKYYPSHYYNYIYRKDSTINTISFTTFLADIEMLITVNEFNNNTVKNNEPQLYISIQKSIWNSLNSYFRKSFNYSNKEISIAFQKIKNSGLLYSLTSYNIRSYIIKYFTNLYVLFLISLKPMVYIYRLRLKFRKN
jgi:glycosyltransferase involved in cell wall biosynthesis